jgi:hypothetical protein
MVASITLSSVYKWVNLIEQANIGKAFGRYLVRILSATQIIVAVLLLSWVLTDEFNNNSEPLLIGVDAT